MLSELFFSVGKVILYIAFFFASVIFLNLCTKSAHFFNSEIKTAEILLKKWSHQAQIEAYKNGRI